MKNTATMAQTMASRSTFPGQYQASRGLTNPTITVKSKKADNTGIAHIKGTPWLAAGTPPFCEGDIEFKYTSTAKTTGYKRKTTTTTWYLEHVKLVSVQTPGVANQTADEDPDGDDE